MKMQIISNKINKKGEIISAESYFENNQLSVRLLGRFEDKTKLDIKIKNIKHYFYIKEDAETNNLPIHQFEDATIKGIRGENLQKVFVTSYTDIIQIKDTIPTWEADLSYVNRFLIDNEIYSGVDVFEKQIIPSKYNAEFRIGYLDIETMYDGGTNKDMIKPINSIAYYDNYEHKFYVFSYHPKYKKANSIYDLDSTLLNEKIPIHETIVSNESELLLNFLNHIEQQNPDVFVAWNANFDITYIIRRLEYLGLNPERLSPLKRFYYKKHPKGNRPEAVIVGRPVIDLLQGYKRLKWNQIESFSLENVGKREFNMGKIKYDGWIKDFWENNFETFLKYNIRDVELMIAINKKYDVIDLLLKLKRISGCSLNDVNYNSKMLDIYILRQCRNKYILPSKKYFKNNNEHTYEGGLVLNPKIGIFKNVIALDMKSLYPSIMLSFNTSYETITKEKNNVISLPNNINFKKQESISKEILLNLLNKRNQIRDKMKLVENHDKLKFLQLYKTQYAYKTFTNSMYGVFAYPSFRLYNKDIAASITFMGRWLLDKVQAYVESRGYEIVRGDTDSILVLSELNKEKSIALGKILEEEINEKLKEWCIEFQNNTEYLQIKFETLYGLFFSSKERKLYAGNITWDWQKGNVNEIQIKGFASKRSDRSLFSRNLQKTLFKMIFDKKTTIEIIDYIKSEIRKILNNEYPFEYIGIPKAISKDIDDYKVTNPWIRGIKYSQKNINGFVFSGKPYLLYIKNLNTDVVCFNNENELPPDIKLDYDKFLDVSVIKILSKILKVLEIPEDIFLNFINRKINNQQELSRWYT